MDALPKGYLQEGSDIIQYGWFFGLNQSIRWFAAAVYHPIVFDTYQEPTRLAFLVQLQATFPWALDGLSWFKALEGQRIDRLHHQSPPIQVASLAPLST